MKPTPQRKEKLSFTRKPRSRWIGSVCVVCSSSFFTTEYLKSIGKGKYCSQKCYWTSMNGHRRNKGHYHTEKTRKKISENRKGKGLGNQNGFKRNGTPWNKGKKGCFSLETRKRMSFVRLGRYEGSNHPRWIKDRSSLYANRSKHLTGHPDWMKWRKAVFSRDGHTCVLCGSKRRIQADHIKPHSIFPSLIFEVSNGRTLCLECHKKTDTWGSRLRTYKKNLRKEPAN